MYSAILISSNHRVVGGIVAPILAILATSSRLFERLRARKFGVDDAWALFSMVLMVAFVAILAIHVDDPSKRGCF